MCTRLLQAGKFYSLINKVCQQGTVHTFRELVKAALILVNCMPDALEHIPPVLQTTTAHRTSVHVCVDVTL